MPESWTGLASSWSAMADMAERGEQISRIVAALCRHCEKGGITFGEPHPKPKRAKTAKPRAKK